MHKVQIRVTYGWSYSYRIIVISWCSTMVFACCFTILCVMTPLFCSLHILFTVRFTFNILDHSIDIGQVFGAIGGMLFSGSGNKSNNDTNENIPEGELKLWYAKIGNISFVIIYTFCNNFIWDCPVAWYGWLFIHSDIDA